MPVVGKAVDDFNNEKWLPVLCVLSLSNHKFHCILQRRYDPLFMSAQYKLLFYLHMSMTVYWCVCVWLWVWVCVCLCVSVKCEYESCLCCVCVCVSECVCVCVCVLWVCVWVCMWMCVLKLCAVSVCDWVCDLWEVMLCYSIRCGQEAQAHALDGEGADGGPVVPHAVAEQTTSGGAEGQASWSWAMKWPEQVYTNYTCTYQHRYTCTHTVCTGCTSADAHIANTTGMPVMWQLWADFCVAHLMLAV